jgi:anti-sigma factor ChrR (cupin superfamily)
LTHVCCPTCRLRFTPVVAAHILACPECGALPQIAGSATEIVGYRLSTHLPSALDAADSAALPAPHDPPS